MTGKSAGLLRSSAKSYTRLSSDDRIGPTIIAAVASATASADPTGEQTYGIVQVRRYSRSSQASRHRLRWPYRRVRAGFSRLPQEDWRGEGGRSLQNRLG